MRRISFAYFGLVAGVAGGLAGLLAARPALSSTPGPQLKLSATNAVPACFVPAQLMQHIGRANAALDPKFREIATLYESHGQKLGLRWDYAFFQMLAETNNLTFEGFGARGALTREHNNFASIRAAESEEPDRFADVSTGVQAHLHHIRLYAGDPVAKPAAKRTKQVEKFILTWSQQLKRPVRFDDMIGRWSPNNPGYARSIETAMKEYLVAHCGGTATVAASDEEDAPVQRQETRGRNRKDQRGGARMADASGKGMPTRPPETETPSNSAASSMLGGPALAGNVSEPVRTASLAAGKPGKSAQLALGQPAVGPSVAPAATSLAPAVETASAGATAAAAANAQCKVWSASFGGDKSVLIRVSDGQLTHFTALQVNAGREKEETTAYIAAYARGGRTVGEFTSADQAISKAFELCPKA